MFLSKLKGNLQTKLMLMFGVVSLIGCLVLTLVIENRTSALVENEAKQSMLRTASQAAETIDTGVKSYLYVVENAAKQSIISSPDAALEQKTAVLKDELKKAEGLGFKRFGIADKNGNVVYNDGSKASIADRDYFKAALDGRTNISGALVSKVDNAVVFICAAPIKHDGEVTGVLTGTLAGEKVFQLVENVTYGRTGYGFVVDRQGAFIVHKELERVKSQENYIEIAKSDKSAAPLAAMIERMVKGERDTAEYTLNGVKKIGAFAPVKTTGWSVGIAVPSSEALEGVHKVRAVAVSVLAAALGAVLLVGFLVARMIASPLALAVNHLEAIAGGNFTQPVPENFLRMKDETGHIVRSIKRLQDCIRPLLSGLKENARTLTGSSETLSAASQEMASSANGVAAAVQQVAKGATEQAGHLQEILKLTEDITANLEKVYDGLNHVRDSSAESSKLADAGKKELDVLTGSIEEIRRAFQAVGGKLKNLEVSVNQVGEILNTINGIADQTNLLALNAAIEAARAGEAGKGFAVVAEEVRKLAEQSRASSGRIKTLLDAVVAETSEVVDTAENAGQQLADQMKNVENTVKTFDRILESIGAIAPAVEKTYSRMEDTVKAKDVVLERVQSVSAVAEETSAAAEEIAASAEELSASTEEIAASSQELLNVAKTLEEQAGRFVV